MRIIFFFFLGFIAAIQAFSQSLPAQWRFSDDNKFIIAGDQLSDGLYAESGVEEMRLTFRNQTIGPSLRKITALKKTSLLP